MQAGFLSVFDATPLIVTESILADWSSALKEYNPALVGIDAVDNDFVLKVFDAGQNKQ